MPRTDHPIGSPARTRLVETPSTARRVEGGPPCETTPSPSPVPPTARAIYGDLTDDLLRTDWWTDEMVAARRHPRRRHPVRVRSAAASARSSRSTTCGSAACPTSAIRVLTQLDTPWQSYEYLTRVSQIPRGERLRSDSASCPDNIWGFPSYAAAGGDGGEVAQEFVAPLLHVLVEPIFDDYCTPKAGQAFESMEQEYRPDRLPGDGGQGPGPHGAPARSAAATSRSSPRPRAPPAPSGSRSAAAFVHVAVGYPGLKFLPDLRTTARTTATSASVVNAYEPHEQSTSGCTAAPGTVVVRGGGIVASRVLQRLIDDRDARGPADPDPARLPHLRHRLARPAPLDAAHAAATAGPTRASTTRSRCGAASSRPGCASSRARTGPTLYKVIGGTNTPKRKLWQAQMRAGARRRAGTAPFQGEVATMAPGPQGTVQVDHDSRPATDPRRGARRLRHRLHRPGGRHPRAPGARRPARPRRRRPQPAAAASTSSARSR